MFGFSLKVAPAECRIGLPQVLPAWHTVPEAQGERACAQELLRWKDRLSKFWQDSEAPNTADVPKLERLANVHYLQSLDHALFAAHGTGLEAFMPVVRVEGLAPGTRRYFLPASGLSNNQAQDEGEDDLRSCSEDTVTGARRIELPRGQ